jgi:hypothetical protein
MHCAYYGKCIANVYLSLPMKNIFGEMYALGMSIKVVPHIIIGALPLDSRPWAMP